MPQNTINNRSNKRIPNFFSLLSLLCPQNQELLLSIHKQQQDILAKLEDVDFQKITQMLADLHIKAHEAKPVVKKPKSV